MNSRTIEWLTDAEQVKQFSLLNHMKVLVRIEHMVTIEEWLQGIGLLKSLLTWNP